MQSFTRGRWVKLWSRCPEWQEYGLIWAQAFSRSQASCQNIPHRRLSMLVSASCSFSTSNFWSDCTWWVTSTGRTDTYMYSRHADDQGMRGCEGGTGWHGVNVRYWKQVQGGNLEWKIGKWCRWKGKISLSSIFMMPGEFKYTWWILGN